MASEERSAKLLMDSHNDALARLHKGDVLDSYDLWPPPVVIMSDGPYGLKNYPGDLTSVDRLQDWYAPHIAKWSERATAETTLWFWNTEVGWATVHPTLQAAGWQYRGCNTWDKGVAAHRWPHQYPDSSTVPGSDGGLCPVRPQSGG